MTTHFWTAFGFSLLAAAVNLGGLILIRRHERFARDNSLLFAAFAAGVLIAAALLQLIPEATDLAPETAPFFLLGGYLVLYGLGQLLGGVERTSHEERRAVALLPLIGIGLHSFIDGIVYSVAFTVDVFTGILAVFGLLLHEFPEGILAYVLLLRGGFRPSRALLIAFLGAAATTPLGMLASYPFVSALSGAPLGNVLAITGGALVFVGASHLVPHVEHGAAIRGSTRAFLAGLGVALAILLLHRF